MTSNRSRTTTTLMVVLATCTGILLSGCASTGNAKEGGPAMDASTRVDEPSAGPQATSESSPQAPTEPAADTGGSGGKAEVQEAGLKTEAQRSKQDAASPKPKPPRTFSGILPDVDWNRIVPPAGGIVAMSLIWGFAFWLARLPLRRRGAVRRRDVRTTREQTRAPVAGEPAYGAG